MLSEHLRQDTRILLRLRQSAWWVHSTPLEEAMPREGDPSKKTEKEEETLRVVPRPTWAIQNSF